MSLFDTGAVDRLNELGRQARHQLREAIRMADVPACVTGTGSIFRIIMKPKPPTDYRSYYPGEEESRRLHVFLDYVSDNGILLIGTGTGMLSTAMGQKEVDKLSEVVLGAFKYMKTVCKL